MFTLTSHKLHHLNLDFPIQDMDHVEILIPLEFFQIIFDNYFLVQDHSYNSFETIFSFDSGSNQNVILFPLKLSRMYNVLFPYKFQVCQPEKISTLVRCVTYL